MTADRGNTRWTEAETALLKAMYGNCPAQEVAEKLGRTESAIYERARREGLVHGRRGTEKRIWCRDCGEWTGLPETGECYVCGAECRGFEPRSVSVEVLREVSASG